VLDGWERVCGEMAWMDWETERGSTSVLAPKPMGGGNDVRRRSLCEKSAVSAMAPGMMSLEESLERSLIIPPLGWLVSEDDDEKGSLVPAASPQLE
jgi:hypothetical protein